MLSYPGRLIEHWTLIEIFS